MNTHTLVPSAAVRAPRTAPLGPVTSAVLDPATLDDAAREALIEELYRVQDQIFAGVDRAGFARYVVCSSAERTWLQVHRDAAGRAVGYFALHLFTRSLDGASVDVWRVETGVLRAYRGARLGGALLVQQALLRMLRHPTRRAMFVCSPVHPSSFAAIARHAQAWPCAAAETPAPVQALALSLAESFGMEQVDPARPLVRKVGWITRDSAEDRAYWRANPDAAVQLFLAMNPGYGQGHGLLTLVPGGIGRAVLAGLRWGLTRLGRTLRARR